MDNDELRELIMGALERATTIERAACAQIISDELAHCVEQQAMWPPNQIGLTNAEACAALSDRKDTLERLLAKIEARGK